MAALAPPPSTTVFNASALCVNQTNPTGPRVPCFTPAPPDKEFLEKYLWSIVLAGVFLCLLISCGVMSYWRNSKKVAQLEARKERNKVRLAAQIKKELAEKRKEMELRAELAEAGF